MKRKLLRIGLLGLVALAIPSAVVLAEGPSGNHGADVSAVAKDDRTTGRVHGEAVSAVARGDHGQP